MSRALAAALLVWLVASASCTRAAQDATPEGAVRAFIEKMESSSEDPRALREAYALLGPRARANLRARADRASRGQGRRYEPWEMLAEDRFAMKFRPKAMSAKIEGDQAIVDVRGDVAEEGAAVRCAREGIAWRVEPELPDVAPAHPR